MSGRPSPQFLKLTAVLQTILILLLLLPAYTGVYLPFFRVKSNSMFPEIPEGSLIMIKAVKANAWDRLSGKVIVFPDPQTRNIVMHRLVDIEGDFCRTQGDNNPSLDAYRPRKEQVLGEVVFKMVF